MVETAREISQHTITGFLTVAECANLFYQAKKTEGLSKFTLRFYKQQLNHWLKFCNMQTLESMTDITSAHIRAFLLWHEETGHSPGGLHAAYRTVKVFLKWYELEAEPDNWHNPIKKVKAPRQASLILEPAKINDIGRIIDTCVKESILDKRDKAIFLFLLDTGCRASELISINLADCNPISGEVTIRKGKGNKERRVYIGKRARAALRAYLKIRKVESLALWLSDDHDRLSYRGLDGILKRRSLQAGIPPQTLHSFRRAFAINMLRAGTDLITLARLMGHADLTVLQRYLKQLPDDLREAHNRGSPVDNLL